MPGHTISEKAKKAGKILKEGKIGGKKITRKQKKFFGFIRGGGTPTRLASMAKKLRKKK